MTAAHDFSKMVPGFDFLQGLMKNAGAALPGLGQWVAPTLDPEELDKRIQELKTVQFWLEQNARMISTTVQALEVQRMTLATLKTMNVQVADLAQAFRLQDPVPETARPASSTSAASSAGSSAASSAAASAARAAPPAAAPAPDQDHTQDRTQAPKAPGAAGASRDPAASPATASSGGATPGVVDPMQWWGALTQQFTQLAAQALKDGSAHGVMGAADTAQAPPRKGRGGQASGASPGAPRKDSSAPSAKAAGPTGRKPAQTSPASAARRPRGGSASKGRA